MSHLRQLSYKKECILAFPNKILTPTHNRALSKDFDLISNELTSRNVLNTKLSLKHSDGKGNILLTSADSTYRNNPRLPKATNMRGDSSKISILKLAPASAVKIKNHQEELFTSPNNKVLFPSKLPKTNLIKTYRPSATTKKKLKLKVSAKPFDNYVALTSQGNLSYENEFENTEQYPTSQRNLFNSKINLKNTFKFSQSSTKGSENQTLDKNTISKNYINGGPADNAEEMHLLMVSIIQQAKAINFDKE